MLGKLICIMTPGLVSSAVKKYTAYNPHIYLISKVTNNDVKYWLQKYFWVNDYIVEKTESIFKTSKKD